MKSFLSIFVLASSCLAALLLASCDDSTPDCRVGADCASGVCGSDGACVPEGAGGTGGASGVGGGGNGGGSGGTGTGGTGGGTGGSGGEPLTCRADHDGTITRAEAPLRAGLRATFRLASSATVDTAGTPVGDGTRSWDLTGDLPGDHGVLVETEALEGRWFAPGFPGATYAARLRESSDLLGVFEVTDRYLLLRGVVSPAEGLTKTELTYEPPVRVLSFPMTAGTSWETTATVTGVASGVLANYTEHYESTVDATGTLQAPFGPFEVLRIRVLLTRTFGVLPTTVRTFLFASECFGTVATIVSADNEAAEEFTTAAEVRRLAP